MTMQGPVSSVASTWAEIRAGPLWPVFSGSGRYGLAPDHLPIIDFRM